MSPPTLALLLGTDDGVWTLLPGAPPRQELAGHAVTLLDARGGVALAGAPGHGVWLHQGRGWEPAWQGDPRCVHVAPDGTLYIGTAPPRVLVSAYDGSWQEWTALQNMLRYQRLRRVDGGGSAVVGIACAGPATIVGVAGAGAFLTLDGGRSWSPVGEGLDPALRGMWAHPERSHRLYAIAESGCYRSEDSGYTWVQSLAGLDRSWACDLALLPSVPDTLLLVAAKRQSGEDAALFRSRSGGVRWERVRLGDEDEWPSPPAVASLGAPVDALFVAAGGRAWGSHDAGEHWLPIADGLPPARALAAAVGSWEGASR